MPEFSWKRSLMFVLCLSIALAKLAGRFVGLQLIFHSHIGRQTLRSLFRVKNVGNICLVRKTSRNGP